jgi:hypothetical protein
MCHDMYNEPFNESWSNLPDCGFHDSEEPPTVG